jgi:hypothetical protein
MVETKDVVAVHDIVNHGHRRTVVTPVVAENSDAMRTDKLTAFSRVHANFTSFLIG